MVRPHARHLDWDGCFNARDLGGLRAYGGRRVRPGALVRADAVDRLTAAGWSALSAHGVRTIIDLRNDDELRPDVAPRPSSVATIHLPLDGVDAEFWREWGSGAQYGTPLCYAPVPRALRPARRQRARVVTDPPLLLQTAPLPFARCADCS